MRSYLRESGKVSKPSPTFITYRDFKHFNHEAFYADLLGVPFHTIFYINNVNLKLDTFNAYIINLFDTHAPIREARITRKKAPWLTQNIKYLMNLRNKALSKYKKSRTLENWEYYRRLRNQVTLTIQNEKKNYLENNIRPNSPKNNWKMLRDLGVYSRDSKHLSENLGSVKEINTYFVNSVISTPPDPDTLNNYLHNKKTGTGTFQFRLATHDEVHAAICLVKTQAIGTDGIGMSMLCHCYPYILPYIVHIINSCIDTLTFPEAWKASFLLPIPKVSDPQELKDLRPISILPTLSKVLERVMDGQIREYCRLCGLLPPVQSGFRKNYSCTTALLKVTDDILEAADRGELTALVLLDYSYCCQF